ncbi:Pyruvate, phosphate dikinase OS=Streptomyces albaduncus OX=68172 GN=FHS32_000500 PE=3 SV=1 [Streptomyces griseoloalbus]
MHPGADDADELVEAVHRMMAFADRKRRLRVRANADNAEDALRARRFGAQGIGLCRTEHMFLGDRREPRGAADPGRHAGGARSR